MHFISALTTQLGYQLKSQSLARRLMLLLIILASLAMMSWVGLRARANGYAPLPFALQPLEMTEAILKLHQAGIETKMENDGAKIKVAAGRLDEAVMLLAMDGIPGNGIVGYEQMDKSSFGQTKAQQEKNYRRMREGELARTLQSIREIERARVHLAIPEESLFAQEEKPPTASVWLKLRSGARLDEKKISGVVHLVSRGIEGLKPENVSVVDHLGNLLNAAALEPGAQGTASRQAFKTQYEDLLKSRIESMLEKVVGPGKVAARVQADFDFTTMRQRREIFNPDDQGKILKSEKTTVEGMPGKARQEVKSGGKTPAADNERTDVVSEYLVSKTEEEIQQNAPAPKRISVAVLVDGTYETTAGQTFTPRSSEELAQLQKLVEATIGFSPERQDVVTVECSRFQVKAPVPEEKPGMALPSPQLLRMGLEWGVVGLLGLLLILLVLRPAMKHILVSSAGVSHPALPASQRDSFGRPVTRMLTAKEEAEAAQNEYEALLSDPPDEIQGNQDAIQKYKTRMSRLNGDKIQREIVSSALGNPQKTVGVIRHWMDEA